MTTSGIRPKVVVQGRVFDEHAKRYVFFPLNDVDFSGSQALSPIWEPKIRRGRITLLESFPYKCQVENPDDRDNGVVLGEKTMGTDAQVAYIMGNREGTGFMERGMIQLHSMVDLDPETAIEIEQILIGEAIPTDLMAFKEHLNTVIIPEDYAARAIAEEALKEMKQSVETAINYCQKTCISLETELAEGRAGRIGIKSLSLPQQYYFSAIRRPLPDDRAGVNAGVAMSDGLKQLVAALGLQSPLAPQESPVASQVELEGLRQKVEALEADAALKEAELEKANNVIKTLTEEEA